MSDLAHPVPRAKLNDVERAIRQRPSYVAPWNAVFSKDHDAARELEELMSSLSQDYFSAGWMIGVEYLLWTAVVNDGSCRDILKTSLTGFEMRQLKRLSERCGGWIIWKNEVDQFDMPLSQTWIPLAR